MKILTETSTEAKQASLDEMVEQTLAQFENADTSEIKAAINNIDWWLNCDSSKWRIFWLKVRRKLERMIE